MEFYITDMGDFGPLLRGRVLLVDDKLKELMSVFVLDGIIQKPDNIRPSLLPEVLVRLLFVTYLKLLEHH